MFVEVAFPLPILKTFYYRCPATCFERLQPGQRLLVPFQNRKLTAYVIRPLKHLPADLPASVSLKEILRPIDASSLISPELFQLSRWISEYYFASQGEVLKACLPRKADLRTKKVATLTTTGLDTCERTESWPDSRLLEKQILRLLAQHGSLDLRELGKQLGLEANDRTLSKLVAEGWVEIRQDWIDKLMSHRQQNVVSLNEQSSRVPFTGRFDASASQCDRTPEAKSVPLAAPGTAGIHIDFSLYSAESREEGADPHCKRATPARPLQGHSWIHNRRHVEPTPKSKVPSSESCDKPSKLTRLCQRCYTE